MSVMANDVACSSPSSCRSCGAEEGSEPAGLDPETRCVAIEGSRRAGSVGGTLSASSMKAEAGDFRRTGHANGHHDLPDAAVDVDLRSVQAIPTFDEALAEL